MITIDRISLSFGARTLFRDVSAAVGRHDRIGLVGSNGSGKSTLLKMLLEQERPDSGSIDRAGNITAGYLPQEGIRTEGKTLFEETESAFPDILELRGKVDQATARLEELNHQEKEYTETLELLGGWEHRLEEMEASKLRSRVESVLFGLGFHREDLDRETGEFSGGWQMRIALAKLLLQEPELLLLDEPTNHLDLPSLRWLEKFLANYPGAIILVSHDRSFLDFLSRRTFFLSHGNLEVYAGNYGFFERESADRKERLIRTRKSQQRKLAQTERFIERFRYKNTKARQVQSRIKALEKIDRIEIESEQEEIAFSFPPPRRSGRTVMTLEAISKSYGHQRVFQDFTFEIERGDRLAIVGVNGAGKSTLSRILAGTEALDSGERKVGHNVDIAFFGQDQTDALDPVLSALQTLEKVESDGREDNLRTILGGFLFHGDDAFKKVSVLSGGERNRLALAKMLLASANFLILDEPTNHLDMRSKSVLQEALLQYQGTYAIISHDRSFLEPLTNKVLEIGIAGWRVFPGSFSEYLVDLEEREQREAEPPVPRPSQTEGVPKEQAIRSRERRRRRARYRQKLAPLKKELRDLELRISGFESDVGAMESAMHDPGFFKQGEETGKQLERYETMKRRLTRAYGKWESITRKLAAMEGGQPEVQSLAETQ